MRSFPEKFRLLTWVSLLLVAGFLGTTLASYFVSREAIRQSVAQQALPLTSDTIYSEIQKDILRPVFISSLMASDTFLRDWMLSGETDTDRIARYLKQVKDKYHTVSAFLVSDKTQRYYYPDGVLKTVSQNEPRDVWFYRVRGMTQDYETNVDLDMANRDAMTIFINHRVFDYDGNFIGATGVGLTLDTMSQLLDSYQQRFHRNIYFVDARGNIKMTGKAMREVRGNITDLQGVTSIAAQILNHNPVPTELEYQRHGATVLLSSRFIPELDWYLLVEQDISDEVKPIRHVFYMNIAVSAAITLLVLALTLLAINRYQRRLETVAGTDPLTGLLNRQAFEFVFQQAMLDSERRGHALSAVLFDVDHFKLVNDEHGHLAGDRILRQIADTVRSVLRESDIVTRWGGEEFLVLLKDCPLQQASLLAEKLRRAIAAQQFALSSGTLSLTASLGVAEYEHGESSTSFFSRADKALYRAKSGGRNRSEISDAGTAQH